MPELNRLLTVAAANAVLAALIVLPLAVRRMFVGLQVIVAAVPALWAALALAAYAYFRATIPAVFARPPTGFILGAVGHGDLLALSWGARLDQTLAVGSWLTLGTILAVAALWLVCAVAARRHRTAVALPTGTGV